jgi:uncharacterized protein YyaL (SSP411 family)
MNRLAHESSPYLRQHADNPVDWYPWGEEAFARAEREDKPILLSVGYSACHWCHVMAHESFEDREVAKVVNDRCVSIKVDREERPDVDAIYMEATQAMTGSGGWPMTVFLTPDRRPFFAGTYYPKAQFVTLVEAVDDAWRTQRDDLIKQADQLTDAIRARSTVPPPTETEDAESILESAEQMLTQSFDPEWGGFGRAPKFPMTSNVELLLRRGQIEMVTTTLDAMASGGIYDHLGGGFARYSVDAFWMVPHFEKMLYDNALIPRAYLQAWQVTGEPRFAQVVDETLGYVMRYLRAPGGGLYSAEDADSEGEEGRFYVWRPEELEAVLGNMTATAVTWYGVTKSGNFEGSNILHRPVRGDLLRSAEVEAARQQLLTARDKRVRPGLDDKVLTEWNAMWIATAAQAGAAMGHAEWIDAAVETAEFALGHLRRPDGRWLRAWQQDSGARHLAYAVDYVQLVDAFTRLAEATGSSRWITEARATADGLLEHFWDPVDGGLWTSGADGEELLVRTKDVFDGATPSANSVGAVALLRLGALTGAAKYTEAARDVLNLLHTHLAHHAAAVTVAAAALDMARTGLTEVVISGDNPDLVQAVHSRYLPNVVLAWGEPYESPLWDGRDVPAAYVCRDYTCSLPATTVDQLVERLTDGGR